MSGPSELLVRQRLRALQRALPEARRGSATAVHRARVATRRLRETLPLVASGGAGRKLQRRVRSLTRALGPIRELDVALEMLDEFERDGELARDGAACLRRVISHERQHLHAETIASIDRTNLEKLSRKAMAEARDRDTTAAGPARRRGTAKPGAADRRAARRALRLRAAIENAAGMYLPDRLHDVRIAVKKLRYSVENVQASGDGSGRSSARRAAALRTLKRAQELLGRMHDMEVLIARTRAVQAGAEPPSLRVSSDLDRFVRRLEMECRQLHAQYIALRAPLLAICSAVSARPKRRVTAA